jgi:murein tripeptide amidase MpaA
MSKFDSQLFSRYQRLRDIYEYLDYLERNYSGLVKIQVSGYSYERRPIKTVHISKDVNVKRPYVFIDAGIHAREWLTNCVALYCVQQLVEEYQKNGDLLDHLNWIILPVANPDGYEYTHTNVRKFDEIDSYMDDRYIQISFSLFGI